MPNFGELLNLYIERAGITDAELARATGLKVGTGRFQQHMLVEIHNDGPVTIFLDSRAR